MTQHIVGYENEVYYEKISNQVYGENLVSMKNLINEELEFIGNFQERQTTKELSKEFLNLEFLDKIIDNMICLDNYSNGKINNQYEVAKRFIDKYS